MSNRYEAAVCLATEADMFGLPLSIIWLPNKVRWREYLEAGKMCNCNRDDDFMGRMRE